MKKIQILGTGCPKCKKLAEVAEAAARELGLEFELEKVTDIARIVDFGVMATPALAVDGQVLSAGKALTKEDVMKLLSAVR
ncbi:MAG TPA: thioredoxin family protein [Synergistaceae bacterium]|jgi:small redox-active disulfide protein 2|nr:thioredoxin family protein [Synergistaceae bacterium]HQF91909.1 thioredoxin family protein [Synergistaceae bacterium]HQH78122.1 thioredoxin family protein [Synergistaceae bacterium]HQK24137.1 thioredoxin family protein [Synergistaceae bacterium]